jgi:hypothetical protein
MMNLVSTLSSVLTSDYFWIAVGSVGAVITLFLTYQQIKRTEIASGAEHLWRLIDKFESDEMKKSRSEIAKIWVSNPTDEKIEECRDVFDFFEDLGILVRLKVIPLRLAWSDFCYWVLPYWIAFEKYVTDYARRNPDEPAYYVEFEYLFEHVYKYDNLMRNRSAIGRFFGIGKALSKEEEKAEMEKVMREERELLEPT